MPKVGKVTLKSLLGHFNDFGALGSVGVSADHKGRELVFFLYFFRISMIQGFWALYQVRKLVMKANP